MIKMIIEILILFLNKGKSRQQYDPNQDKTAYYYY